MRQPALSLALLSTLPGLATAQQGAQCISLKGSRMCPAFDSASVSTQNNVIDNLYARFLAAGPLRLPR